MRKNFIFLSFFILCSLTKRNTHTSKRFVKSKPIFKSEVKKETKVVNNKKNCITKDEHRKVPIVQESKKISFQWPVINSLLLKEGEYDKNGFLNLSVKNGTEVHASATGVVAFVGREKSLPGKSIIIYHDAGYLSIYSNISKINVSKGEIIQKHSKVIGHTKSLLFFSIRKKISNNIKRIDFKKMLNKR